MSGMLDPEREAWLIRQVEAAAEAFILPRFRRPALLDVQSKSAPDDLVTKADLECEAALTAALAEAWPEVLVVGEEAVAADPDLLGRISEAETCVILDPVDGTWNFANGLALFGVIVAVTRFGVPIWGGLYDPLMRDWVIGRAGQGAVLATGPERLPLTCGAAGDTLSGYVPVFLFPEPQRFRIAEVLPRFHRVNSLRCSCQEYRMVAQGRVDFVLSGVLKPWDHAAGVVAVSAAGGVARMLDGAPYRADRFEGVLLSARDEATWQRVAETFSFLA